MAKTFTERLLRWFYLGPNPHRNSYFIRTIPKENPMADDKSDELTDQKLERCSQCGREDDHMYDSDFCGYHSRDVEVEALKVENVKLRELLREYFDDSELVKMLKGMS